MIGLNKKILIKKKTKIYILAPANTFTGGPECLHQLAFHLNKIFKTQTFVYYLPNDIKQPTHKNFRHYNIKYTNIIEDQEDNILIMPEHLIYLNEGLKFRNIRKIIWWLSIDNYYGFKFKHQNKKLLRSIMKIPYNIISLLNKFTNYYFGILSYHDYLKIIYKFLNLNKQKEIIQASFHLTQSYYAHDFLKNKIKNLYFLFDFQNKNLLKSSKNDNLKKKDLICYSHKSNRFIQLLKKSSNRNFIELKGFNSKQIIEIFKKTKIYIDFGYHPGKDKMPREAVLFNNCIITNNRGSAENKYDIPIPKKLKFKQKYSELNKINLIIDKFLKDYKKEIKIFRNYKKRVLNEENIFKNQLKGIFLKRG